MRRRKHELDSELEQEDQRVHDSALTDSGYMTFNLRFEVAECQEPDVSAPLCSRLTYSQVTLELGW
jgi:hypothetical protein